MRIVGRRRALAGALLLLPAIVRAQPPAPTTPPSSSSTQPAPPSAHAAAPPAVDFSQLRALLARGDRVLVIDARQRWVTGRLTDIGTGDIALAARGGDQRWAAADVLEVRRLEKDPVRDGLLKGVLAGAAFGSLIYAGDCDSGPVSCESVVLSNALTFGVIGTYLDWRNLRSRVMFTRQPGAPRPVRHSRADLTFGMGAAHLDLGGGTYPTYSRGFSPADLGPALLGAVGWRWTPRLATEAEFACLCYDRVDIFEGQILDRPASYTTIYFEHHYRVVRPSISQLYSPWPDARWQPFVGLAIAIDVQRTYDARVVGGTQPGGLSDASRDSYRKQGFVVTPMELPVEGFSSGTVRTTTAHAFGRAGLKVKVTNRTFLTIETQVGKRASPLRVGIGVFLY